MIWTGAQGLVYGSSRDPLQTYNKRKARRVSIPSKTQVSLTYEQAPSDNGHRTEISGSGTSGHNLGRKILWMYLAQSLFFSFLPYIPIGSLFADFRMDHSNVVKFKKEVAISYLSVIERPESFIWVLVSPKHQINTWRERQGIPTRFTQQS